MKPEVHHGADGLHHGSYYTCVTCKAAREAYFRSRWDTSYWQPGQPVYDHYVSKKKV